MPNVDVRFEDPRRVSKRPFTDEEQQALRAAADRALDLTARATPPQGARVARWMGVLPPAGAHALAGGVTALHAALAQHPVGFVVAQGSVGRIRAEGAPPPLAWMQRSAAHNQMRTGSALGLEIEIPVDDSFFASSEAWQSHRLFQSLSYQVLGALDVVLPVLGPIWHPALCQRLAATLPTWALLNGTSWAFYLSSIDHDWR